MQAGTQRGWKLLWPLVEESAIALMEPISWQQYYWMVVLIMEKRVLLSQGEQCCKMKVTQLIIGNYRVVSALGGKEFVISEYLRPNPSNNHGNIILKIEDNEDNYVVSLFKKPSVADAQKLLEEEIIKDMSSQFSNLSSGPSDPSQPSNQGCLSSQCDLEDATAALQQYEINPRPPLQGSPIISATQLQLEEDNILPVSQCVLGEKRSPLLCQAFPPPLPDINDRGDGSCVSVEVMTICGDDVPTGQEGRVPGLDIGVSGLVGR